MNYEIYHFYFIRSDSFCSFLLCIKQRNRQFALLGFLHILHTIENQL
jgi:hypothetical protein